MARWVTQALMIFHQLENTKWLAFGNILAQVFSTICSRPWIHFTFRNASVPYSVNYDGYLDKNSNGRIQEHRLTNNKSTLITVERAYRLSSLLGTPVWPYEKPPSRNNKARRGIFVMVRKLWYCLRNKLTHKTPLPTFALGNG